MSPVGFLEERPGTKSSVRLALLLIVFSVCVFTICVAVALLYAVVHLVHHDHIADGKDFLMGMAAVIGAATGFIGGLLAGAWGQAKERNAAVDAPTEGQ